ncbi:MAG: OstA-like protein [Ferruginibacter sp.]
MKSTFTSKLLVVLLMLVSCSYSLLAQSVPSPPASPDTLRIIQIIHGDRLREKTTDSVTNFQTIAGHVLLKEGLTLFYCDSATINRRTNILEAFGNVHINQNDSIHTYAQNLRYIGNERVAYLKKDVRLTDNKGILYTQDLEYDLKGSIGKYKNGGRVVNGKTILTSTEGTYYAETKDVYFKKNVHLVDPKYDMRNDTLLYNTQTQVSSWATPTVIKSKNGGDIYSSSGTYDLKNGKAFFGNRSVIKDSTRTYVANNSAYDEESGIAQLIGDAVIKDSVNAYTVLGGEIYLNKNDNSFLATRKPVLIFKGEGNDSTFIAGDTLFSGVEKRNKDGSKIIIKKDTLKNTTVLKLSDSLAKVYNRKDSSIMRMPMMGDSAANFAQFNKINARIDSLRNVGVVDSSQRSDSSHNVVQNNKEVIARHDSSKPVIKLQPDSLKTVTVGESSGKKDSVHRIARMEKKDSLQAAAEQDSLNYASMVKHFITKLAVTNKPLVKKAVPDTAIRYFIAFHNVRIFNDSLQSVCDSLYYTSEDSVFRLFKDPLVFSNNSQIAGDTIYLFTKNKKADRLYVFEKGNIINKPNESMYNQVEGRTINGYFKEGQMDYARVKGSPAESVYYPQDDDSAYIGMNRSKGDVIDVFFVDKAVNKVKFINDVDGTLYPLRLAPQDQKYLKGFKWLDKRRPKSKLELFE